ncbi:MAG: hypothetical protein V4641_16220 [Pseudomonadota bacterium]
MHHLRAQQLRALVERVADKSPADAATVQRLAELCGAQYDTINLSDKSLEEIDKLAGHYFE